MELVFAVLLAGAGVWLLASGWCPVLSSAVRQLPDHGYIHAGQLEWGGPPIQALGGNDLLALGVDLNQSGESRAPADVQIAFGRNAIRVYSLFGYCEFPYPDPAGQDLSFNRPELEPWWGAWETPLLWISVAAILAGSTLVWFALATLQAPLVWLTAFFANRDLAWRGSWKIAGAALMPGMLLLLAAIVFYGLEAFGLLELLAAVIASFGTAWTYIALSLFFVPRLARTKSVKGNPFQTPGV